MITAADTLNKVLRFEWPCQPLSILSWLNNQKLDHKFYYSSRDEQFEMGGLGTADCLQGHSPIDLKNIFGHIKDQLSADYPYLRYYGGLSFASDYYHFFIPRFEIVHAASKWTFAFNILAEDIKGALPKADPPQEEKIKGILKDLEKINFESPPPASPVAASSGIPSLACLEVHHSPNKKEWEDIFAKVKQRLREGALKKIVLARETTYEFNEPLNPWDILASLKEKTRSCFHFCLNLKDQTAFLGASPERLFKREGRNIQTEALAGTTPRGKNDQADQSRKEELLFSVKDNQEHLFVVNFIKEILKKNCSSVKFDKQPKIFEQMAGYHLMTQFNGILHSGISDDLILSSLHPTPAVGGYPQGKALKSIQELEPFDRGWYAGVLGFVGYNLTEFCVAIRSGLVRGKNLTLYAGAGIVEESTCEGEWEEIEGKIRSFNEAVS